MGRFHNPFPIDLVLAGKLFPVMEAAAKNLEHIPQFYEDIDHFLAKFSGTLCQFGYRLCPCTATEYGKPL